MEISDNDLQSALEKLSLDKAYGGFDKEQVEQEFKIFQWIFRAVSTTAESTVTFSLTAKEVPQFIGKRDFTESIPKLCLIYSTF